MSIHLLQRYVFWETTKVFVMAMTVATLVMTLGVGVNEGIKRGIPFGVTLQIMPFVIPETLRITVPASLLFSVCTVFGRMGADRELAAAKSLGVHPIRLLMPAFVLGFVLSLGTFVMYEVCAAWARPNLRRTLVISVDEIAYQTLKSNGVLSTKDAFIAVQDVRGRSLISPRLEISKCGEQPISVEADLATLSEVGDSGVLRFECQQLAIRQNEIEGTVHGAAVYDLPFAEPDHKTLHRYSPAELPACFLDSQIRHELAQIDELQNLVAAGIVPSGERVQDSPAEIGEEMAEHELRLRRLEAEFPRRLSNGFAALAFALIGIPVAVRKESHDNMSVFMLCMAPIAMLYYPLLVVGETLAKNGFMPALIVWLSPAVLAVIGCVLLRNLFRR